MAKQNGTWQDGTPKFDNESIKLPNGLIVRRTQMIGCPWFSYEVWIQQDSYFCNYSTMTTFGGKKIYGSYATKKLPNELEKLPAMTNERSEAVTAWLNTMYEEAYTYIYQAFPKLQKLLHKKDMGKIDYFGRNPA